MREGEDRAPSESIYDMTTIKDILAWCERTGLSYWEYVQNCEGPAIWDYLAEVWKVMREAVERGIEEEGVLPGGLGVRRKAVAYYMNASGHSQSLKSRGLVYAYALAVSEENAAGGKIVTAPTCGSCGIVPACAMAAAAASQLFGGTPAQIEYSAEMGLEHHLGLTCDPVCGLVQIPCIERNAYAAARALDANLYAAFSDGRHSISFDRIVSVMKQTGNDIPSLYKETALGGLAAIK